MPTYTDQIGHTISLPAPPRRIVSLVPSQTELLHALGLDEEVVGITKFCTHPAHWFRQKPRVGGTKDFHPARIQNLHPDLIIANKEENDRSRVQELALQYPVWTSDIHHLTDALAMIRSLGALTGKQTAADRLATDIDQRFASLASEIARAPAPTAPATPPATTRPKGHTTPSRPRTAYLIWRDPWMAAGGDTFIHDMLEQAGFENIFGPAGPANPASRYPSFDLQDLARMDCRLILLSSEPYPFREKHISEITAVLPQCEIHLVDGEMFSWYGSRLLQAPAYFRTLHQTLRL